MKLKDYIIEYDNCLSKDYCSELISAFEARKSVIECHDTPYYKFEQLNLNTCDMSNVAETLVNSLIPYFENYFERVNLDKYVDIQGFEHVRIKKYYKNSDYQFKPHLDVTDHASAKRYLIAIAYLNDNDGVTDFPQLGYSCEPKTGKVVMFPPTWQYLHSGNIPVDNDKYIMMTSLHYS